MRKKTAKYAWDKKSDSELQLWPETSTERYITRPFVNARVLGGKSGKQPLFSWPEFLGIDPLERYAILSAARTKHLSDYYQSRAGADFHLVLYTVGGGAELSYESGKSPLTANTFAFVPAGCPYELRSLRCARAEGAESLTKLGWIIRKIAKRYPAYSKYTKAKFTLKNRRSKFSSPWLRCFFS